MATTYRSFAKINLHLEVLGRREDGYHELRTLFQSVSLHDEIVVEPTVGGIELEVGGRPVASGPENLAHRAARAYFDRWGEGGVRLVLRKRIPVGGGLGGGSSNAATVLLALRDLMGEPRDANELVAPAAELGADVPFFLVGGTALGTGRGDVVEALRDLVEEEVWLVDPGISVSTAEVFADRRLAPRLSAHPALTEVLRGDVSRVSDAVGVNDLEGLVLERYSAIKDVYTALVQTEAKRVRVSGSGATLFAFGAGAVGEPEFVSSLPAGGAIFRVRTLSRASVAAQRVVTSLEGP